MQPFAYSARTLAQRWHTTPATIYRLIREGHLSHFAIGASGRRGLRVPASEVERWERGASQQSSGEATGSDSETARPLPSGLIRMASAGVRGSA